MNVLAIGAHFDDVEVGCSGSLAKHVDNGDNVFIYVVTKSGWKNSQGEVIRKDQVALEEGQRSASILGAKLITGDFNTFEVEFDEKLNSNIIDIIEKNKIDTIYTHWIGDSHHDHQAIARSTMHCSRRVNRLLSYKSNWYEGVSNFKGNFYVDISNYWSIKENLILQYESEMNRTNKVWIEYFKNEAINNGYKIGSRYAEVFELIKWII